MLHAQGQRLEHESLCIFHVTISRLLTPVIVSRSCCAESFVSDAMTFTGRNKICICSSFYNF